MRSDQARDIVQAAQSLRRVTQGLDASRVPCPCCGLQRYTNPEEYKLHKRLSEYAETLEKIAREGRGKG